MFQRICSCCLRLAIVCCTLALTGAVSPEPLFAQQIVGKQCENCGRAVPITSEVGDTCPHCGVTWGARRDRYVDGGNFPRQVETHTGSAAAPHAEASTVADEPEYEEVASPTGRYRLTRSGVGWVDVYDTRTEEHLQFAHDLSLRREQFSTDEEFFVTLVGGRVHVWDLSTGAPHTVSGAQARFGRDVEAVAFLHGEHTLSILRSRNLYFQDASGKLVYGRITAGSGEFLELVVRYSGTGRPKVFARMTNARTGIYDLSGARLTAGQRLPQEDSSTRLTLRD